MIIDGHLHLSGDPQDVLSRMDALGIQRTVLVGVGVRNLDVVTIRDSVVFRNPLLLRTLGVWKSSAIVRSKRLRDNLLPEPDNSKVMAAIQAHPDRFWAFAFINPAHENALVAAERLLASGFNGLKLALLQYPVALESKQMLALCELAQARRVPIFFHQGLTPETANPELMFRRFPKVNFIIAHAGVQYFEQVIELARDFANVWLDTSSYFVTVEKLSRLISEVGARKLVFGSDFPVMALDPGDALKKIMVLRISECERAAILGGNLLEILNEKV